MGPVKREKKGEGKRKRKIKKEEIKRKREKKRETLHTTGAMPDNASAMLYEKQVSLHSADRAWMTGFYWKIAL